jgi:hypothetical protein
MIGSVLLALGVASHGCTPHQAPLSAEATASSLTRKQADDALKTMLREHPDAFRMASTSIQPKDSRRFIIDLTHTAYRIAIHSGACTFDYDGRFALRGGVWSATEPELRSVGKHLR